MGVRLFVQPVSAAPAKRKGSCSMSDEIKSAKGFRKLAEGRPDIVKAMKKARRGRPPADAPKVAIKLRIDPDIVARFKAGGPGYQSRMNRALRDWLESHTEG